MNKPSLLKAQYFTWIIVPISLWLFFTINGSMGLKWSYSYAGKATSKPWATRYYTKCSYIVWGYGIKKYYPRDGKCPALKLFKV